MNLKVLLATTTALTVLAATGVALAAGSSTFITQTGDSQSASIDQSGSASGAKVGTSATSFVQENGLGTGGNKLVINQNSKSNSELSATALPVSSGAGNTVTGFQSGTNNNAEIDQMGSNSSVALNQTGANNGTTGTPFVTPNYWSNSLYGNVIVQDGTASESTIALTQTTAASAPLGNTFNISQGGSENDITATQTGYNKLWIRQGSKAPDLWGWTFGNPFDSSSPIGIAGSLSTLSDSTISVTQNTTGIADPTLKNYAALGQGGGSGNILTVNQFGASNNADANQVGSSNTFSSTQTNLGGIGWNFVGGEAGWPGGVNPLNGVLNDFRPIAQVGTGNVYDNTQTGTNLWALGSQVGNYLSLNNTQSGDTNKLFSTQTGSDNSISNIQSGNNGSATYTQSGSFNVATLQDQKGSYNKVDVTQTGAGNVGSKNTVTMLQQGGTLALPNSITLAQSGGAGNSAFLVQGGLFSGTGALTTLTLTGGLAGNGNKVNGTQAGDTNYAAVSQNGSSNAATFSQNGTGNSVTITQ